MRGHKPPGHPPALYLGASARRLPAGDGSEQTHQGKGRGGPGGLRVGRPSFPNLGLEERRCKMQEIATKRKKKKRKRPPTHPRNAGKPPGKRGKGNPPTQKKKTRQKQRGRRKTQQGEPHPPREKEETATRPRKTENNRQNVKGEPRLEEGGQHQAHP